MNIRPSWSRADFFHNRKTIQETQIYIPIFHVVSKMNKSRGKKIP